MKVPVSIRSGMISAATGRNAATPRMVISGVPAPEMSAPIRVSTSASAVTSGSHAAWRSTVVPSARTAAIRMFSVPVTVTMSKVMSAPRSRSATAVT